MITTPNTLKTPTAQRFLPRRFQVYNERQLDQIAALRQVDAAARFDMQVVANVLPFRVNQYVIDELIDWQAVPDDPIYQLTFPQRGMLEAEAFSRMADLLRGQPSARDIRQLADTLRAELNPHPAGQQTLNVPRLDGNELPGVQHKYAETVLFFPSQGQVCHSYCTFCFRWAQFVGDKTLRFASAEAGDLTRYLRAHPEVTDVLITGGDPLVMKASNLKTYLEALLAPGLEHVRTIRIGTKALTYWPYRFVTDSDADELLRLFERVAESGRQLALMTHINHWRELEPAIVRRAVANLRDTGAVLRAQAPLLAHINDDAEVWARLWTDEVNLGIYPYYMFVERDTGARRYFEVPLARAWEIYRGAVSRVSGLARTARGPSMSAGPGKVEVQGVTRIHGEDVFVLRFIQGRNPDWVQQPFFARFDPHATWLDQLEPALGEAAFFYEPEYRAMLAGA
ncbi:MAG: lysine 2,3-aminomutase [Gammaproteobacteria bacterium]|nr:lysine 2,3-aminomutase [Gammaproteobacteria bacterium]MCP5199642.1 lysine 2,3-aminomutase [Gammaproteobacteria bacterium]